MDFNTIITFLACVIFLFIFGKIFILPLKTIFKLIFNSILGGILLYVINIVGANFGFHIGINIFTSLCAGILGIPGAILLVILELILRLEKRIDFFKNILIIYGAHCAPLHIPRHIIYYRRIYKT